jgi:hypothetical protein
LFVFVAKQGMHIIPDVVGDEHEPSTMMTLAANAIREQLYHCKSEEEFLEKKKRFIMGLPDTFIKETRIRNWDYDNGRVIVGWQLATDYEFY